MPRPPQLWGLHATPSLWAKVLLSALPFILIVSLYLYGSHRRLQENPDDKILPSVTQMAEAVNRMAFTPDKREGKYLLFSDTASSLKRLLTGVVLAAAVGLFLGLNMGIFASFRSLFLPLITFISIIPPLALLPILFITFGVDELGKVMLIFIGIFPIIARDIYCAVSEIPKEQITKALTLGASQLEVVYKVILPQIVPRLVDSVRLSLGAAWLFLIASEAIASTDGLGYRIFLMRRYLAMDIIIPYTLWITFLGFTMDWLLKKFVAWRYRWYLAAR
jgi:ABC-type nitrate/sulfonate/bicarbonate transport system, permease component